MTGLGAKKRDTPQEVSWPDSTVGPVTGNAELGLNVLLSGKEIF